MRERLLIRWPYHIGHDFSWGLTDAHGRLQGEPAHGDLEQCAQAATGRQIVVLVPAADVLLTRVSVPTRNRSRLLQAVPYALEDQLAEDVATLHFALGPATPDGGIAVAVVARERMTAWLDRLQEVGLRPDLLVPETLALPAGDNEWSVLVEGNDALLRTGLTQGGYTEAAHLPLLVESALKDAGEAPPGQLHLNLVEGADALADLTGVPVARRAVGCALEVFAAGIGETPTVNLLQGTFSRREQAGRLWRPWRAAAVLAGVWIVVQGGVTGYDIWRLQARIVAQDQQITQLFRAALPGVQRIVDPRAQMEQRLRELRGGAQSGGALALLAGVSEVLQGDASATLNAASYRGGRLDLDLELKDIQALDRIKQQTTQRLKSEAQIVSASTQGDKVSGRLRVGGGS